MRSMYLGMDELVDTLIEGLRFYRVSHLTNKVDVRYPKEFSVEDWSVQPSSPQGNAEVDIRYIFKSVDAHNIGDTVVVMNLDGTMKVATIVDTIDQPLKYKGKIAWVVDKVDTGRLGDLNKLEAALMRRLISGQRNTMRQNAIRNVFGDSEIPTLESIQKES